jgi:8-amino-7-oxononanoate synthase
MPSRFEHALEALERRGRLRALSARVGIDFSSNDYLGLGASTELRDALAAALARGVSVGAGGSRLLRGNDPEHEALEAEAAQHFGAQAALFFGGGFVANYALFSTLPSRGDLIVYDSLIHASALDGIRASKAEAVSAAHNTAQAFEDAIKTWRTAGGTGRPWIAVESLYSMDGDRAPLAGLVAIAARHDAMLMIDEAHATGVWGEGGRGLAAHFEGQDNVVSLHTCGKALGVSGALVLCSHHVRDYLVNRCRPFIYATAPSPLIAAGVRAALTMSANQPQRRDRLIAMITSVGRELETRCGFAASGSQIQPIIVGSDARATALAAALQAQGFDIRAVRPPTVPEGTARLRISLTLNATEADVERMIAALAGELQRIAA